MAQKIIKFRLFTWFEEVPNQVTPGGEPVYTERIATMGQDVDITNDAYVQRGEELGAFYSDEEADAIRDGTYSGPDAAMLEHYRTGVTSAPEAPQREIEGGGALDVETASAQEIGDYIADNSLSIDKTLALVPDDADADMINKFLDAENHATNNSPRKGVEAGLEAKLHAQT